MKLICLPFHQYLGLVLSALTEATVCLGLLKQASTNLGTCSLTSYSCFLKTKHQVVSFCDWIAFR